MDSCRTQTIKNGSWAKRAVLIIIVALLLYSSLWFVLTQWLHSHTLQQVRKFAEQGQTIHCDNLRKTGYPLRIGLVCDQLNWQDTIQGAALTARTISGGAPLYAPSWQFVELEAPAQITLVDWGEIAALWRHLTIRTNFTTKDLNALSLSIEDLQLDLTRNQEASPSLITAAQFIHLQIEPMPTQHIKANLSFDALRLPLFDENTPTITGEVALQLDPLREPLLIADLTDLWRGRSGQMEKGGLQFSSGGGLTVKGNFHVSLNGILSGQFTINLQETAALLRTMRAYFPDQSSNLDSLFFALNALPKDDKGNPKLTLDIHDGQMRVGFIPLGTLPQL